MPFARAGLACGIFASSNEVWLVCFGADLVGGIWSILASLDGCDGGGGEGRWRCGEGEAQRLRPEEERWRAGDAVHGLQFVHMAVSQTDGVVQVRLIQAEGSAAAHQFTDQRLITVHQLGGILS